MSPLPDFLASVVDCEVYATRDLPHFGTSFALITVCIPPSDPLRWAEEVTGLRSRSAKQRIGGGVSAAEDRSPGDLTG